MLVPLITGYWRIKKMGSDRWKRRRYVVLFSSTHNHSRHFSRIFPVPLLYLSVDITPTIEKQNQKYKEKSLKLKRPARNTVPAYGFGIADLRFLELRPFTRNENLPISQTRLVKRMQTYDQRKRPISFLSYGCGIGVSRLRNNPTVSK